jgi:2-polyprenyl-3-methyl-5-hydroxy-6-metoxy-1,4-benzoquinol methylase
MTTTPAPTPATNGHAHGAEPLSRQALFDRYTSTFYTINASPDVSAAERQYLRNFGPLLPPDKEARILDIGCGMGLLLSFLKHQGYRNLEGFELSAEQVEACHRAGLESVVCISDLGKELAARPGRFDAIFMTDVLEHIPKAEILPTLEAIRRSLRPGGRVVIRVPNLAAYTGPYSRYLDFTHEVGFVEKSLAQVLLIAGFTGVEMRAEELSFRSPLKGAAFLAVRSAFRAWRRVCLFMELPGSPPPKVLSPNLIGVAQAP